MGTVASSKASDDMSWGEVAQLGLRYGKIPLALLAVEALYWFITQPSDTLALIQVTEAYIWNEVTQLDVRRRSLNIEHTQRLDDTN